MNSVPVPLLLIRPSAVSDLPAIASIYGWHVLHGTGTFELAAPTLEDLAARRDAVLEAGLPWLVAERAGSVRGFAYASHFRARRAYRFCVEDSIYLAADALRQGLGRLLLAELLARCEAAGARQMLAVIGDSANHASLALHRALGFEPAGLIKSGGWKQQRWIDVVLMQKQLGSGAAEPPPDAA